MTYNRRHQTPDTRHQRWQLYVHTLSPHTVVDSIHHSITLVPDLPLHSRQPSHPNRQLSPLLPINHQPHLGFSLKRSLALVPLLLLPYATTTQALSATTAQVIHGTEPYFTFDNGATKVTTTEGLLGITISDGTTQTTYTPSNNTSTAANPIVLPIANQRFTDIGMLVPTNTNTIEFSALIGAPNNYWGDDDGDGQGANGVTATGNIILRIKDKYNEDVSRSASIDICQEPYKVELSTNAGSLTTQYGLPNSRSFSHSIATYYIRPKAHPKICYAGWGNGRIGGDPNLDGPDTVWNRLRGFIVQSTEPSGYSRNFPTTGANNLYFDLDIGGIKGSTLTWPTVSQGGITATMTPTPGNANNIRVTLTGPVATAAQRDSNSPGSVATPTLPQTLEIVGYDSSHTAVLKYGFELKQWFVNRGKKVDSVAYQSSWCTNLGGGYHLSHVKELTNSKCGVENSYFPCVNGVDGATPSSTGNYYQRNIGAGLFTEWGSMRDYTQAGFMEGAWTSDSNGSKQFYVNSKEGRIYIDSPLKISYAICAYP